MHLSIWGRMKEDSIIFFLKDPAIAGFIWFSREHTGKHIVDQVIMVKRENKRSGGEHGSSLKQLWLYLTEWSPNGVSMAFAPAKRHCSMHLLTAAMMSDELAVLALKMQLFLSFHSSQDIIMIMVLTPFLAALSACVIMSLTAEFVFVCSSLGRRSDLHPFHVATSFHIAREQWQFQNKCTDVSRFLMQNWQK